MIKRFFTLNFLVSCISVCFFSLIFIAGVLQSCEDEPYQIGLELLPEQDDIDVEQVDTLTIETYLIGPAAIPVYDSLYFPFGNYSDQVFGHTKAGMVMEFSPAGYYVKINQGAVTDTVIMNIYYDTIYGGVDYVPQVEVFAMTEGIDKSARYYSDFDVTGKYDPENLSISGTEKPDTTNRLRIRLQNSLGESLLQIPGLNDSLNFTTYKIDSIFDDHFKGLYLNPVTDDNSKGLITVRSVLFTVWFHTDEDTLAAMSFAFLPEDTRYLNVGGTVAWLGDRSIKIFEHDYNGSTITHLNDSTYHDSVLYLQSLGGTQAIIKFPSLEQLRETLGWVSEDNPVVSVNNAELIIPVLDDSAALVRKFYPTQLGVRILNDADDHVPDDVMIQASQFSSPVSYMNGRFSNIIWAYRFNLTAYFQEYFKGSINSSELLLFAARLDANIRRTNFNPINYNSVLLAGSSNIGNKITLKVAYTKL